MKLLLILTITILINCASRIEERGKSYLDTYNWYYYQKYLPEDMKFTESNLPKEEYFDWKEYKIHIDRYSAKNKDCLILIAHGGGGNGRLVGTMAIPLLKSGCEIIAPDLPGYGLSVVNKNYFYEEWVHFLSDLIDKEKNDFKKIYIFGLSIGGSLSYHVAAKNKKVDGLIMTTFLNLKEQEARDAVSKNLFLSRIGMPLNNFFWFVTDHFYFPIKWFSKMDKITNDPNFSEIFMNDPYAGGGKVSMKFLRTFLDYTPEIDPENFTNCPVLLVHPKLDPWTPPELSVKNFNKIKSNKKIVFLTGAGHFPYEEPGKSILFREIINFINDRNKIK